jgi:hypothetical protein
MVPGMWLEFFAARIACDQQKPEWPLATHKAQHIRPSRGSYVCALLQHAHCETTLSDLPSLGVPPILTTQIFASRGFAPPTISLSWGDTATSWVLDKQRSRVLQRYQINPGSRSRRPGDRVSCHERFRVVRHIRRQVHGSLRQSIPVDGSGFRGSRKLPSNGCLRPLSTSVPLDQAASQLHCGDRGSQRDRTRRGAVGQHP